MNCERARRMMARKASRDLAPHEEQVLADHLSVCPGCARLENELERTWSALGLYPAVEPSPKFLPGLRAKLQLERPTPEVRWTWPFGRKWQWAAWAGCFLLAALVLTRTESMHRTAPTPVQTAKTAADSDRADEQFLQDLDDSLQHSAADYLSTYDSWPGMKREAANFESPAARPPATTGKKESI